LLRIDCFVRLKSLHDLRAGDTYIWVWCRGEFREHLDYPSVRISVFYKGVRSKAKMHRLLLLECLRMSEHEGVSIDVKEGAIHEREVRGYEGLLILTRFLLGG
jgi:hypothetical protein